MWHNCVFFLISTLLAGVCYEILLSMNYMNIKSESILVHSSSPAHLNSFLEYCALWWLYCAIAPVNLNANSWFSSPHLFPFRSSLSPTLPSPTCLCPFPLCSSVSSSPSSAHSLSCLLFPPPESHACQEPLHGDHGGVPPPQEPRGRRRGPGQRERRRTAAEHQRMHEEHLHCEKHGKVEREGWERWIVPQWKEGP